jgi:hypothetical protein
MKLTALTANMRSLASGFDLQSGVAAFAQDGPEAIDGQYRAPRPAGIDAIDPDANAYFHVGTRQDGTAIIDFEFYVLQYWLWAAVGRHSRGSLERCQHFLTITTNVHAIRLRILSAKRSCSSNIFL